MTHPAALSRCATGLLMVGLLGTWALGPVPAQGAEGISAQLNAFEETPSSLNSNGTGVFLGLIDAADSQITYQLFYVDLGSAVLFAHIHFGKPGESGGVAAFLCGGGSKGACPANGDLFQGTITAADVQAIAGQNLPSGEIAPLLRAIRNGFAYVNVHTDTFQSGELRGQIKSAAR